MKTKTKEQLQDEINERRRALDAIESKEREAVNLPLIGKCFKYRNNYSMPKKPSDYWWLYIKVLSADGYNINVFEFQTDANGNHTIKPSEIIFRRMSEGYQPITAAEFNRAWFAVQNKLLKYLP